MGRERGGDGAEGVAKADDVKVGGRVRWGEGVSGQEAS